MIRLWGVLAVCAMASGCGSEQRTISGDTVACANTVQGACVAWLAQDKVTIMLNPEYKLCSVLLENAASHQVSLVSGVLDADADMDHWNCRTQAVQQEPQRIVSMSDASLTLLVVDSQTSALQDSAPVVRNDTVVGMLQHMFISDTRNQAL